VEIREKRGFPPPLGKVSPKSGLDFPTFPQALLAFYLLKKIIEKKKAKVM
jgi:hypothetical protein